MSENLMKSLLGKLYQILAGGDDTAPPSKDSFVVWCAPGIPFEPEDLAFAEQGPLGGATAEAAKVNLARAADFSRLVNLIPSAGGVADDSAIRAVFNHQGESVWDVYADVLKYSQVAAAGLTKEEEAKLLKFQNLLRETVEKKNIVTDEITEVVVDGPVLRAYNAHMADYLAAVTDYNNKRISAMNSDDATIVRDWALNASNYRSRVKAALDAWVSGGYKNDVEQMNAFIDQVTGRSMLLMKRELKDRLERSKLTNLADGQDFYYSAFVPANFVKGKGWTKFSFKEENEKTYSRSETNAWTADTSVKYSIFSASASTKGSIERKQSNVDTSGFAFGCEITQVPISRPWFAPEFLRNRGWKQAPSSAMGALSDGGRPPKGLLPAYATTAVFVRNITVDFNELHKSESTYAQQISAKANVGIGPFTLSGGYDRSVGERSFESKLGKSGLEVPGMQLIALKCALLPASPNPSPEVKQWE